MLEKLIKSIRINAGRAAFVIKDREYTYADLARCISGIRHTLHCAKDCRNGIVGVYTDDSLETYASIFAIWFEGMTFLPLNPKFPVARNLEILRITDTTTLLYAGIKPPDDIQQVGMELISTAGRFDDPADLTLKPVSEESMLYILFTSGSTGIPKGVPISRRNFHAFLRAFMGNNTHWNAADRFLQMFDLTFDVSVQCFTVPLLLGASIYTVSQEQIKYLAVYRILEKYHPTVAVMVPSVISFLRPYLEKIFLPAIRHTVFTGEAVPLSLVEAWLRCCPNTRIDDCYGPTEATIYCLSYRWDDSNRQVKSHQGVVSIGKPLQGITACIVDGKGRPVKPGTKGELIVAGDQVTEGYLNSTEKNKTSFIELETNRVRQRFYRTGDLVFADAEGDYMYCGRLDDQVQVQGFRVELGEIEFQAGKFLHQEKCIALAGSNQSGNTEIYLFITGQEKSIPGLTAHLQSALPFYMQPNKVILLESIPLNSSGKTDRNQLKALIR
jgi:amino acid adenylation domain-containing protein